MNIQSYAFRVDASLQIGYGHIIRCLTLANELSKRSHKCFFICRKLESNLLNRIIEMGHQVFETSKDINTKFNWEVDLKLTQKIIKSHKIDWLVIDHYLIDSRWEEQFMHSIQRLMVIDDLANRKHLCDILLDSNLGKTKAHYQALVPTNSKILTGTKYCLISEEFLLAREQSIKKRSLNNKLKNILINIGASDPQNLTLDILRKLGCNKFINEFSISIVMSSISPYSESIKEELSKLKLKAKIFYDVLNMSEILLDQDLVIGSVGVSAWERCVMGIPSISIIAADNQFDGARALHASGASIIIDQSFGKEYSLDDAINFYINTSNLNAVSALSSKLVDGKGVKRVVDLMT